jgi:hypothetical protein
VVVADGFLGRWSQRKQAVREGKPLTEPPPPVVAPAPPVSVTPTPASLNPSPQTEARRDGQVAPSGTQAEPAEPPLSLDDVKSLTAESDYAPFVSRAVSPEVRNAAMKKLFTDPHYNVMDRLDIYIDDYSLPDPLPASMLRQMASAKFLKLFDDEEKDTKATALGDDANNPDGDSVAQSTPNTLPATAPDLASAANPVSENLPAEPGLDHDHTDLRLQPNHAAGPPEPGRSTG